MNAGLRHPADWPLPAKMGLLATAAAVCLASGLFLFIGQQRERQHSAQERQRELQHQFKQALERSTRLPTLRQQQNRLAATLLRTQDHTWDEAALDNLQRKLSRRAEESGLSLTAYRPAPYLPGAAQAETTLHLTGSYAALTRFIQLITAPPHPLVVTELEAHPQVQDGRRTRLQIRAVLAAPMHPPAPGEKP